MDASFTSQPSPSSRNRHPPAAFMQPTIPTLREPIARSSVTTIGVVQKYVNFGKGWRPRLFVVENGVLSYYKVYGPTAVNVQEIIKSSQQRSVVQLIGARTLIERDRSPSLVESSSVPHGELHLQVSNTRASEDDNKKFYVYSGTKVFTVKAETSEDRSAWLQALNGAQSLWTLRHDARTPSPEPAAAVPMDSGAQQLSSGLQQLLEHLSAGGVSQPLVAEVQQLFMNQQHVYQEFAAEEANKRSALLKYISELEDAKRELELQIMAAGNGLEIRDRISTDGDNEARDQNSDDEDDDDDGDPEFLDCLESEDLLSSSPSFRSLPSTTSNGIPDSPAHRAIEKSTSLARPSPLPLVALQSSTPTTSQPIPSPFASLTVAVNGNVEVENGSDGDGIPEPEWLKPEPTVKWRDRMPPPQQAEEVVSLWQLIKGLVGKDLTRICLPVYFNEPISALQKCCEDVEYSELITAAAKLPAYSMERMYLVATFAVSGYSGTLGRTCKPFNPLLGETFEFIHKEKGYRFLAEKVVHHPMILACMAEGKGWTIAADIEMKSSFWGRKMEIFPDGIVELRFHDGEVFRWTKVVTSINNIIIGKINVTHGGVMRVRSVTSPNNLQAKLTFHEPSYFSSQQKHAVTGHVERDGQRVPGVVFKGTWDDRFGVEVDGVEKCLWVRDPQPADPTRYNLTKFVMGLNEMTQGLKEKIAPTDSRFRPDQLALERGIYDVAFHEKVRLEERQRAVRKAAEKGTPLKPRWFEAVPNAKQGQDVQFNYMGGYWETRAKGGPYTGCRDIYGH